MSHKKYVSGLGTITLPDWTASVGRKTVIVVVGSLLTVTFLGLGAVGWYYSGVVETQALGVDHSPSETDLVVAAVGGGSVTFSLPEDSDEYGMWLDPGVYGAIWNGGHAQLGSIIDINHEQVTRELIPVTGELTIGQDVEISGRTFVGDPASALDIPFEDVSFTSDRGDFDAWLVDGDDDTWAIYTHGKGADRGEALRMIPIITDAGLTSLVITYRNDDGVPTSESGHHDYGLTEWYDLEAAVQYALDYGASDIVLVGYSMGGGITANFLYQSDLADEVVGVILDSPMLDFRDVIDFGGERRGLPSLLTGVGELVAGLRFGIDWDATDYTNRFDQFASPILLFHGDIDRTVHKRTSDQLATERADIVTYVEAPGAGHVRAWNVDQDRYAQAVTSFIEGLR